MKLELEKNTTIENAVLNQVIQIPMPSKLSRQGKRGGWNRSLSLHPQASRGLSDQEWNDYTRRLNRDEAAYHQWLIGNKYYRVKKKEPVTTAEAA